MARRALLEKGGHPHPGVMSPAALEQWSQKVRPLRQRNEQWVALPLPAWGLTVDRASGSLDFPLHV